MDMPSLPRIDTTTSKALELVQGRTPSVVEEKVDKQTTQVKQPQTTPDQAPKTPILNKSTQTFSNLLLEMGIPNTTQNNQLAQTLASYGQPINKGSVSHVSQSLGQLMNQGQINIEAGVVLLVNNLPINEKTVDAVKQILSSGGLSQNLISVNKDLKKLVESFNNVDFVKELSSKIESKKASNQIQDIPTDPNQVNTNKQNETTKNTKAQGMGLQDHKVDATKKVIKNADPEQEEENNYKGSNQNSKQSTEETSTAIKNNLPKLDTLTTKEVVTQLQTKAQKISENLTNLLTIDVLKNPAQFPHQIAMLRKYFSDIEVDLEDLKDILKELFPELSEGEVEEENIFVNMLKLAFNAPEPEPIEKKVPLKNNLLNSEFSTEEFLKEVFKSTESLNLNMFAREMLTKSLECMCIPIPINFNNKQYNAELMINREDKDNKKTEVGNVPLKLRLSIDTYSMGKVAVDISNLKKDLQVFINVENNAIKSKIDSQIRHLDSSLSKLPFEAQPVRCIVLPKPEQSPSILLPSKYTVMSMKRIDGVV